MGSRRRLWAGRHHGGPAPSTIAEIFALAARKHPQKTAYVEETGDQVLSVSWSELECRARRAATALSKAGLQRGDRVALCGENSIDWIVAYLAAIFAGGVGVLIYYDQDPEAILNQVNWPQCRWLMASASVLARLANPPPGVRIVQMGAGGPGGYETLKSLSNSAVNGEASLLAEAAPRPDDLAAIIYTSGTTGGAKGVMLTHANFIANASAALQVLPISESDSTLLVLPLHHAMPFIATIVLVSMAGGQVVIQNDLLRVRDSLTKHRPTIFFGVPALFDIVYRNILARAEAEGKLSQMRRAQEISLAIKRSSGLNIGPLLFRPIKRALGGRMRFLVSGGAALNPETVRNYASLGLPLLQGWGMTEASPIIAVQRYSVRRFLFTRQFEELAGSVGPALPGVEVRLSDVPEKGIIVSREGEGEILVRGANVFQGYWNAPELSQEATADGWLHTGDLGRLDKRGNLFLTGRSKSVIVLDSGEKLHPEELEERLAQNRLFEDVCVVGREVRGKVSVTAVVYPNREVGRDVLSAANLEFSAESIMALVNNEVSAACRGLAAHKRISRVEISDRPLPRTALRKVARGQLDSDYLFSFERWLEMENPPKA